MGGGLRPGFKNFYTNKKPSIYCSPDFNVAMSYAD